MYCFLVEYIIDNKGKVHYTNLLHSLVGFFKKNNIDVFLLGSHDLDSEILKMFSIKEKKIVKKKLEDLKVININYWGKEINGYKNIRYSILDNYPELFSFLGKLRDKFKTKVINNAEMMKYNMTKNYLVDFKNKLPFFPTKRIKNYEELLEYYGRKKKYLLKPLISERSIGVYILNQEKNQKQLKEYYNKYKRIGLIIQPYMDSFKKYGERKLCFINGKFIFARKESSDQDIVHSDGGSEASVYKPTANELLLGKKVYEIFEKPVYFRLDLTADGEEPIINEVEMINPDWCFFLFKGKEEEKSILEKFNKEMLLSI